jgi:tripartite ATP-independent transporter DctP family solute receptor
MEQIKSKIFFFNKVNKILSFLFFVVIISSCQNTDSDKTVLKLSHAHDQNHPIHKSMLYFSSYLDSISNGDIKVQIYPGEQLGKEREALELLQIGTLDITKVSAALIENFIQDFEIFGYPYLFKDINHYHRVLQSPVKDSLFQYVNNIKLVGLTFLDAGSRNIYTATKPISHTDDLKGLKLRVMQSNTMINMAKSLGASPTPIAMAELFTALQQGMVDGAENNLPTFYASRHFEVCNYFHLTEHVFVPDIFVFSEYKWNKLSEKNKAYVLEAAEKMALYHEKVWAGAENTALENLKKEGIEILYPDKDVFIETSGVFYDGITDEKYQQYIQLIKSLE